MKRREFLRAITGGLALPLIPVAAPCLSFLDIAEMQQVLSGDQNLLAAARAWLESEEHRILYGTGEHRPMGLLDCRSPLKVVETATYTPKVVKSQNNE